VTNPDDSVELEADPVDVIEQRLPVSEDYLADESGRPIPIEADPADVVEQQQSVGIDDDDYRQA
jgi:hypothetical protein